MFPKRIFFTLFLKNKSKMESFPRTSSVVLVYFLLLPKIAKENMGHNVRKTPFCFLKYSLISPIAVGEIFYIIDFILAKAICESWHD